MPAKASSTTLTTWFRTMSTNPADNPKEQFIQALIADMSEQMQLSLHNGPHPIDDQDFVAELVMNQLSATQLRDFQSHVAGCLYCYAQLSDLRGEYQMPWLEAVEQAEDAVSQDDDVMQDDVTSDPLLVGSAPSRTLSAQQLRSQLLTAAPVPPATGQRSTRRVLTVVAAIAAALLVLVPGLRTLRSSGGVESTFVAVATLSDYGLSSLSSSRDLDPKPEDVERADRLQQLLQESPEDAASKLNLAAQLLQNRRLEQAQTLIEDVLRERPDDPQVLNALGLVQVATEQPLTAIETFRRAVNARPVFVPAVLNLADMLNQQQRGAEAQEVLRAAILQVTGDEQARLQQKLTQVRNQP